MRVEFLARASASRPAPAAPTPFPLRSSVVRVELIASASANRPAPVAPTRFELRFRVERVASLRKNLRRQSSFVAAIVGRKTMAVREKESKNEYSSGGKTDENEGEERTGGQSQAIGKNPRASRISSA